MPKCGQTQRPIFSVVHEDNISFYRVGDGDDPNTGERDEDSVLFGQGRCPERQQRDVKSMSIAGAAFVLTIVGAVLYSVVHN